MFARLMLPGKYLEVANKAASTIVDLIIYGYLGFLFGLKIDNLCNKEANIQTFVR